MAPLIGYWKIRGLAEPVRMLHVLLALSYSEIQYSELRAWQADRAALQTPFANLPYYVDECGVRCETACILEHVCRRHAPSMLESPVHQQCFHFLLGCIHTLRSFAYGYLPQSTTRDERARTGKTGALHLADVRSEEALASMRALVLDQVAQCLDARAVGSDEHQLPFLHGTTAGVCDVLLWSLVENAKAIGVTEADLSDEARGHLDAFRSLPSVAAYLSTRPSMPLHAPFATHNAIC